MEQIKLGIKGMHCMGCALGLEEKLENLHFVESARANYKDGFVEIKYHPEQFDLKEIEAVVSSLGFEMVAK